MKDLKEAIRIVESTSSHIELGDLPYELGIILDAAKAYLAAQEDEEANNEDGLSAEAFGRVAGMTIEIMAEGLMKAAYPPQVHCEELLNGYRADAEVARNALNNAGFVIVQREPSAQTLHDMALTYRHDFGLLDEAVQHCVIGIMQQIYDAALSGADTDASV